MKAALIVAFLTLVALKASAQQTPEAELAATLENFKQAFARQDALEAKAIAPARAAYLQEITKLRDAAKAKGDLDTLVDAEAALKAAAEDVPAPSAKKIGAVLLAARMNFDKARDAAIRNYATGRPRLEADFERAMTVLEQKCTRAGNLAAAQATREARTVFGPGSAGSILPFMKGQTEKRDGNIILPNGSALVSDKSYAPPVELTYVFQTDGQIRFGYAADDIIFNWEDDGTQLRIDGGPASGQHKKEQGSIPKNAWVTVKQTVQPGEMSVSVNGERRALWKGDFRRINSPLRIWAPGSTLTLKAVTVRKIDAEH